MKIFGINFTTSSEITEIKKQYSILQQQLKTQDKRGMAFDYGQVANEDYIKVPLNPLREQILYSLANNSDILRTVTTTIKNGIFRRGIKVRPKFGIDNTPQKNIIDQWVKKANKNGQKLIEVLKEFEDDLNINDDAYLGVQYEYYFAPFGDIIWELSNPTEILRLYPPFVRIVADKQGRLGKTDDGKTLYVEMDDRTKVYDENQAKAKNYIGTDGKKMGIACYRVDSGDRKFVYYLEHEIIHKSKYKPSLIYGYSNIHAIYQKILTLIYMDRFMMLAYQKYRPPRGLLVFNTRNFASVKKSWEELKSEAAKDPNAINPMLLDNDGSEGKSGAQWIDLMKPNSEMQYIEARNEMRRAIGSLYGVMPLFSGDIEMSGGLNNEGLQFGVTNRALEEGQKIYNDTIFPAICDALKVTDYEIYLEDPEEQDETEDAKRLSIKIDNASKMKNMGFEVTWVPEKENFLFSEMATQPIMNTGTSLNSFGNQNTTQDFAGVKKGNIIDLNYVLKSEGFEENLKKAINDNAEEIKKAEQITILSPQDKITELAKNISQSLWKRKFDGIPVEKSDMIKELILGGVFQKISQNDVIKQVVNMGIAQAQAEMIVRTETQAIQNSIREFNYAQAEGNDKFRFKWIGPEDDRTTEICEEIKNKTKDGVSLSNLKKTMNDVAVKYGSIPREWTPHIGCRHSFVRAV